MDSRSSRIRSKPCYIYLDTFIELFHLYVIDKSLLARLFWEACWGWFCIFQEESGCSLPSVLAKQLLMSLLCASSVGRSFFVPSVLKKRSALWIKFEIALAKCTSNISRFVAHANMLQSIGVQKRSPGQLYSCVWHRQSSAAKYRDMWFLRCQYLLQYHLFTNYKLLKKTCPCTCWIWAQPPMS